MFHLGVRELSNQFGFHLIRNLGRYLGVPLLHERCKALDFQFVLDRMSQKLNSWKSRFLSLAGRVTLAQFTLATISYIMQTMKIPNVVCAKIDRICIQFIWSSSKSRRKLIKKVLSFLGISPVVHQ